MLTVYQQIHVGLPHAVWDCWTCPHTSLWPSQYRAYCLSHTAVSEVISCIIYYLLYDAILVWSTVYLHGAWICPTVLNGPLYDLSAGPSHPTLPSQIPTYIKWDQAVWSMCGGPRWPSDLSYILALYIDAFKTGNSSAFNSQVFTYQP